MNPIKPLAIAAALLALSGAAPPPSTPPADLLAQMRKAVLAGVCDAEAWTQPGPLSADLFTALPDGRLLLFAQIPDYLCRSSNQAFPIAIDAKGRWTWGAPLPGSATLLARRPGGSLLAVTQWQIEGTYPALFESKDGLTWRELPLPKVRATQAPDEIADVLCVAEGELRLQLASESSEKRQAWARSAASGAWRELEKVVCPKAPDLSGGWKRTATEAWTLFERGERRVQLPAALSKH